MDFPTKSDVAREAGVCHDSVNSYQIGRRPDPSFRIREAEQKLGYVSTVFNTTTTQKKEFKSYAVAGDYYNYLPLLAKILDLPIIVPANEPNDPIYLIRRYYTTNVLLFNLPLDKIEDWFQIDRKIILIDCPEQFIFNSINGFSIPETVKLINLMIRNYRTYPMRISKKD